MKSTNSIEVHELQYQIDRKLNEIQEKRRIRPNNASAKIKDQDKVVYQIKWNTIKRHIRQMQRQNKTVKVVQRPMKNGDLLDVINKLMLLQKSLIELSKKIANYRRLQMFCIFFYCWLSIVFNAYNFAVFLLKMATQTDDVPLSLAMLLFFYGYHITSSMMDIIFSVVAYNGVFESLRKTATKMDELNMYILDSVINARISQISTYVFNNLRSFTIYGLYNIDGSLFASIISGTATYIIILIQYSGDGEICKTVDLNMNKTQSRI